MNRGNPPSSATPSGRRRRRGTPPASSAAPARTQNQPSPQAQAQPSSVPDGRRRPSRGPRRTPSPKRQGENQSGPRRRHRGPLRVAAGIIRDGDKILITQRKAEDSLGGFWEFPGGKLERDESYPEALKRELMEEIGVEVVVGRLFATIRHKYPGGEVKLCFLEARIVSGEVQAIDVAAWKWVVASELGNFRFPPADGPLIKKLQSVRGRGPELPGDARPGLK